MTPVSMTCRGLFERLSEFVDGDLSLEVCQEIQRHLEGCGPCVAFARTLKATAELCRRLPSRPIPPDIAADLHMFLAKHLCDSRPRPERPPPPPDRGRAPEDRGPEPAPTRRGRRTA